MKPLVLCILDGVGYRDETHGNAVKQANMPTFNGLWNKYPHSLLEASGELVGLPKGQMGNSEVGHTNIGAGRTVYQPLQLINELIKDQTFYQNEHFLSVIKHVKENNSKLHLFGLLSDGGIHSHINHLIALLELCKKEQVENVYLHMFLDGRDTLPNVALTYLDQIDKKCKELGIGKIATLSGRYYAMDRDNRWDRIETAYKAIVEGIGEEYSNYQEVIEHNYQQNKMDEFIVPAIIDKNGLLEENDGLILFNYRPDRIKELFKVFTNIEFNEFPHIIFNNIKLVTMMPLSDEVISTPAFELQKLTNTLGDYISNLGKKQLRIAETEKYAHVTYFFDGGVDKELKGANRILVPSPKVATYDLLPEMSALEVTNKLIEELDQDYDLIIVNYANGDMVGHTGDMEATIKALETIDHCLERLKEKVEQKGGILVVTADHGNSDIMLDDNNQVITSHTTSKVPFIVTKENISLNDGKLGDIAPTLLGLMELKIPTEMTGDNLVKKVLPRRKNKLAIIFCIFSLLLSIVFGTYYIGRFVHYRNLEKKPIQIDNTLTGKILSFDNIANSGLTADNKNYFFKGQSNNNYVYYSGRLWRIIQINEDKTIKLISDEAVTSLIWNKENNDYKTSTIRSYLNDNNSLFYKSLNNPTDYLEKVDYCIDQIDSQNTDLCNSKINDYIGLLTYQEYKKAGANNSFINSNSYFWLANSTKDNKVWYVFPQGGVNSKINVGELYYNYGVRPVITLKSSDIYYSGDGTKEKPYHIEPNNQSELLNEKSVGEYVTYSGYLWRIMERTENGTKVLMNEPIKKNNSIHHLAFSSNSNQFKLTNYSSIAYYLNNTFYNSLQNKNYLVKNNWYIGSYDQYNYQSIFEKTVSAYVGLPHIGEITFSQNDILTLTPSGNEFIYMIRANGSTYTLTYDEKSAMIPAVYLKSDLKVVGGDGSKDNPYQV